MGRGFEILGITTAEFRSWLPLSAAAASSQRETAEQEGEHDDSDNKSDERNEKQRLCVLAPLAVIKGVSIFAAGGAHGTQIIWEAEASRHSSQREV